MKIKASLAVFAVLFFYGCGNDENPEENANLLTVKENIKVITDRSIKEKKEVKNSINLEKSNKFQINIKNGHLGKVFLGMHENATDGNDRGMDSKAPPPGMQTGYTTLISPNRDYLYTDMRKPADEVEYTFYAKNYPGKPVILSWSPENFQEGYTYEMVNDAGKVIDMAKIKTVTFEKEQMVLIIAKKLK